MSKAIIQTISYQQLVKILHRELTRGLRELEKLIDRQKILSYHAVGKHIYQYLNQEPLERGAIGDFYEKLSKDLKISVRTLQHCEQFYRYFPVLKSDSSLTWSHYRYLLRLPSKKDRNNWLKCIERDQITSPEFRIRLIEALAGSSVQTPMDIKEPERGKLYTYRLVKADPGDSLDQPWMVDCGFANRIEAPSSTGTLHNKYLVTSEKTGKGYRLKIVDSQVSALYTFKARVLRVIDADTLSTRIDQGFSVFTDQKLRLRGLDAPEIKTLAGQRAKRWLEEKLSRQPFVIVKTYKSDKYDRYLVNVFTGDGSAADPKTLNPKTLDPNRVAQEGTCLNAEMLELGLAIPWN